MLSAVGSVDAGQPSWERTRPNRLHGQKNGLASMSTQSPTLVRIDSIAVSTAAL
jgi:hypothetical protein